MNRKSFVERVGLVENNTGSGIRIDFNDGGCFIRVKSGDSIEDVIHALRYMAEEITERLDADKTAVSAK